MRNKPNFPCAFVRLKNRFCNELPSRAEGAFDALRVLFCKAVIYFLLMPTITMNPKSFWNRIRVFNIPNFFKKILLNGWDENDREKVRHDAFKGWVFWEGHKIWKTLCRTFDKSVMFCVRNSELVKKSKRFFKKMWTSRIIQTLTDSMGVLEINVQSQLIGILENLRR